MREKQRKDDDKPKHNFPYQSKSSKDLTATQPLPSNQPTLQQDQDTPDFQATMNLDFQATMNTDQFGSSIYENASKEL